MSNEGKVGPHFILALDLSKQGEGLLDAGGVEQFATAGAGDCLLAGAVLTEPGVLGLGVRADGRDRDLGGADGATDRF